MNELLKSIDEMNSTADRNTRGCIVLVSDVGRRKG